MHPESYWKRAFPCRRENCCRSVIAINSPEDSKWQNLVDFTIQCHKWLGYDDVHGCQVWNEGGIMEGSGGEDRHLLLFGLRDDVVLWIQPCGSDRHFPAERLEADWQLQK